MQGDDKKARATKAAQDPKAIEAGVKLLLLAEEGNITKVEEFLKENPNIPSASKDFASTIALDNGHTKVAQAILDFNKDLVKSNTDTTPQVFSNWDKLMGYAYAVNNGNTKDATIMAKNLPGLSIKPQDAPTLAKLGTLPLMLSVDLSTKLWGTNYALNEGRLKDQKTLEKAFEEALVKSIIKNPSCLDKLSSKESAAKLDDNIAKFNEGIVKEVYNKATRYTVAGLATGGVQLKPDIDKTLASIIEPAVNNALIGQSRSR